MKPRDEFTQRLHVTTVNRYGEITGGYLRNTQSIGTVLRHLREWIPGMSQTKLAKLTGTTQSRISELEDFTYKGTTLKTLQKVADALGYDVAIVLTQRD